MIAAIKDTTEKSIIRGAFSSRGTIPANFKTAETQI